MKFSKIIIPVGLLALASVAASAQQSIPALTDLTQENPGDLILGFSNAGASKDLVVDLGPASNYYTASTAAMLGATGSTNAWSGAPFTAPLTGGTTYTVNAFNTADLTTVYGASANSTSTFWSVVGGNGNDGGALASTPDSTIWVSAPSPVELSASVLSQQGLSNKLDGITNSLFGGSIAGLSADAYTPGTKSFTQALGFGNNFNYFASGPVVGNTSATSSLNLFELQPTVSGTAAGVDLGTFTLSSSGLTFTAASAIPEPSTYAMILGAAALGFVMMRRRQQILA